MCSVCGRPAGFLCRARECETFSESLSLIDPSNPLSMSLCSTTVKCPHSVYSKMSSSDQCQKWASPGLILLQASIYHFILDNYTLRHPPPFKDFHMIDIANYCHHSFSRTLAFSISAAFPILGISHSKAGITKALYF